MNPRADTGSRLIVGTFARTLTVPGAYAVRTEGPDSRIGSFADKDLGRTRTPHSRARIKAVITGYHDWERQEPHGR